MDQRTIDLADRLANEVHPELGQFVLDLAEAGESYEAIYARLQRIMEVAAAARKEVQA